MRLIPWVSRNAETSPIIFPTRILDEFFSEWPVSASLSRTEEGFRPAVDVLEKDGNLILRAELPGVDEKAIELKLEGNVLTLRGEKKAEETEDRDSYRRVERFYGSFSRSFTLPESIDKDKIQAKFKHGVLTITIPQKPEVKPRAIPVTV